MSTFVDRIKPDSYGITTYLENLKRGQYQIPTFQRDVVWDRERIKRLWDSVYKYYPLGSILVWRTDTELHDHRSIGGHPLPPTNGGQEHQYLLDGQQRTTALLTSIYGGDIKDKPDEDPKLFVDLSIDEPEDIEDESWKERFLFWDEIDDRGGALLKNKGRQSRYDSGLVIGLSDIAHRYQEIEERLDAEGYGYGDPERRSLRRFKNVLDNYKLSFIELRGIDVAEVCQIFERVNQAGEPLNMFDIVVAKTYRPIGEDSGGFYLRGLFEEFRHELEDRGSRYSALDNMTLLRVLAVLIREEIPDAGIYNITDTYLNRIRPEHIEHVWDQAKQASLKTFDFLENHLRLPGPNLVPYVYMYMTLAAYLYGERNPDYDLLKKYFWFYAFHAEDLLTNTTHLREHVAALRGTRGGTPYPFPRFYIDRDRLRRTSYSSRGRMSRAILALYASRDPVDWKHPDRSVLVPVYYSLTDRPNLHHIFPRDYCEKNLGEHGRYADSLMNIAYLTQITNLEIGAKNPLEYLREYITDSWPEVEGAHLLPDVLTEWVSAQEMPEDALDSFVEERCSLVLEALRARLAGLAFEVIDSAAVGEHQDVDADLEPGQ